ncbi:MAG: thiamine biosynthesis protein, partial [Nitrosopumilaceae archaeon]|nr:thiamine biosynthesis protein [Nitrosopumilaceae archaeon]
EKFLVKVEGTSKGFLPNDVEIAATSSIIEKKSKLGAKPGTKKEFDKLVYSYLTKNNAYVCIFIDEGLGGVPYGIQEQTAICCVFDELSAINALNTIRQGYKTKIVVCYKKDSELMNLVKIINQIIPRLITKKIELGFFHINFKNYTDSDYPILIAVCLEISLKIADNEKIKHISIPASPTFLSGKIIDEFIKRVTNESKIPLFPLFGTDRQMFNDLQELGISSKARKVENMISKNFKKIPNVSEKLVHESLKSEKKISVDIGPNNVHDILDALE